MYETMSEEINELAAALALAQGAFRSVPTTQTAIVKGTTKQGKAYEYSYKYASLSDVFEACRPGLSKNGLSVSQLVTQPEKGRHQIESLLMHSSGQWLRSVFILKATDDPQDMGGQITYYRRYALSALVGLATEEDQDAQHSRAAGQERQQAPQQASQPSRPGNGQQARRQPPPGQQDREAWLAECKAVFLRLSKEQQAQLLGKFSAGSLEAVTAANQERFKNALVDLAAAASG